MQQPSAIHVSPLKIVALYELESGERVAHEHTRIGELPRRRGTWRKDGKEYIVTFGTESSVLSVIPIDELLAAPLSEIPAFRRDLDLRIEKHFGKSA